METKKCFVCKFCNDIFDTFIEKKIHLKSRKCLLYCICCSCNKPYNSYESIKAHINRKHKTLREYKVLSIDSLKNIHEIKYNIKECIKVDNIRQKRLKKFEKWLNEKYEENKKLEQSEKSLIFVKPFSILPIVEQGCSSFAVDNFVGSLSTTSLDPASLMTTSLDPALLMTTSLEPASLSTTSLDPTTSLGPDKLKPCIPCTNIQIQSQLLVKLCNITNRPLEITDNQIISKRMCIIELLTYQLNEILVDKLKNIDPSHIFSNIDSIISSIIVKNLNLVEQFS